MYDKFKGRKITLLCTNGEITGTIDVVRKSELVLKDSNTGGKPEPQTRVPFSDILDIRLAKAQKPKTPPRNTKFEPNGGLQICWNDQIVPCCSSLQLLSIRSMLSPYGHSEANIIQSAAIGVALLCCKVLDTDILHTKTIVVLVGHNAGGAQAIACAHRLASLGAKVAVCSWSQLPSSYRPCVQAFEQVGGQCLYTKAEILALGPCDLVLDALQSFDGTPIADQVGSEEELNAALWLMEFALSRPIVSIECSSACGNIALAPKAIASVGFPLDKTLSQDCPIYLVNLGLSRQSLESLRLRRHSTFVFPAQQLLECTRRNFIDYAK